MLPTIKVQQIPKFYHIIKTIRYISDISFCQKDPLKLELADSKLTVNLEV